MAGRTWYANTARDIYKLINAQTARTALRVARKRVQQLQRRADLLQHHPRYEEIVKATMELQNRLEMTAMQIGFALERQGFYSDADREKARRYLGEALHALIATTGR